MKPPRRATDLRELGRQTQTRLILGGLALLFIVGGGLIWLIYGRSAAALGIGCMAFGLLPVLAIWAILQVLDWVSREREE